MRNDAVNGLEVRRQVVARTLLLQVSGELDAAGAPLMRGALATAIDEEGQAIVVDLAGVSFLDSEGLGALVAGLKRARALGAHLRFVVTHPRVWTVLNITGLANVLDVYPSLDDALTGRQDHRAKRGGAPDEATDPALRAVSEHMPPASLPLAVSEPCQ